MNHAPVGVFLMNTYKLFSLHHVCVDSLVCGMFVGRFNILNLPCAGWAVEYPYSCVNESLKTFRWTRSLVLCLISN